MEEDLRGSNTTMPPALKSINIQSNKKKSTKYKLEFDTEN